MFLRAPYCLHLLSQWGKKKRSPLISACHILPTRWLKCEIKFKSEMYGSWPKFENVDGKGTSERQKGSGIYHESMRVQFRECGTVICIQGLAALEEVTLPALVCKHPSRDPTSSLLVGASVNVSVSCFSFVKKTSIRTVWLKHLKEAFTGFWKLFERVGNKDFSLFKGSIYSDNMCAVFQWCTAGSNKETESRRCHTCMPEINRHTYVQVVVARHVIRKNNANFLPDQTGIDLMNTCEIVKHTTQKLFESLETRQI